MSRQRIRTLKPEAWADEKIGSLSREARLLFWVLVSFSDDEGRFRAVPAGIIGFGYPYDEDVTPVKLRRWLGEIAAQGIVLLYERDGREYGAFRHFRRHQRVNRASESTLPSPPDPCVVTANAVSDHGKLSEQDVTMYDSPAVKRSDPAPDPSLEDHARKPDREHVRLSQLLADLIRQRDPKAKAAPLSKGWLDAIRLLIERDGRTPAEVERVIRWCQADAFWQSNILSAPKLRAKFDQLAAKAGTPGRLPQPGAAEADALVVQWLDKEPEYEAMRRPA